MQKKNQKRKTNAWLSSYDFSNGGRNTIITGHTTFKWFSYFLIKIFLIKILKEYQIFEGPIDIVKWKEKA